MKANIIRESHDIRRSQLAGGAIIVTANPAAKMVPQCTRVLKSSAPNLPRYTTMVLSIVRMAANPGVYSSLLLFVVGRFTAYGKGRTLKVKKCARDSEDRIVAQSSNRW